MRTLVAAFAALAAEAVALTRSRGSSAGRAALVAVTRRAFARSAFRVLRTLALAFKA